MSTNKLPLIVSARCIAAFAWLDKPDSGQKYSNDKFKITGVFDKEDPAVKAMCKEVAKIAGKEKIKDGNLDKKGREEFKGKYLITFQSRFQPTQVDSKRQELPPTIRIMSGDVVKIAFTPREWDAGKFTLDLNAVQLIEKRNKGKDYSGAFEDEEGFVAGGEGETEERPAGNPADGLDF